MREYWHQSILMEYQKHKMWYVQMELLSAHLETRVVNFQVDNMVVVLYQTQFVVQMVFIAVQMDIVVVVEVTFNLIIPLRKHCVSYKEIIFIIVIIYYIQSLSSCKTCKKDTFLKKIWGRHGKLREILKIFIHIRFLFFLSILNCSY